MKNVCIVGCGAISGVHAEAIKKSENARLYAVCDVDAEKMKRYNVQQRYTDFGAVLEDNKIDSVHICTPHYLHYDMIKQAIAHKKSVVCEKPAVMKPDELDELSASDGAENICCVLQNRLNPCAEMMYGIIKSGESGTVKCAKGIMTWYRGADYYASGAWRGHYATEGGGVLINQALHTLDLLCLFTGGAQSVQASSARWLKASAETEETVTAQLNLRCGGRGIFFATTCYGENPLPEIEVCCENMTLEYRGGRLYRNGVLIAEDRRVTGEKAYWGTMHDKLISDFYDRGRYIGIKDCADTLMNMFAMYESMHSGGAETPVRRTIREVKL